MAMEKAIMRSRRLTDPETGEPVSNAERSRRLRERADQRERERHARSVELSNCAENGRTARLRENQFEVEQEAVEAARLPPQARALTLANLVSQYSAPN